MWRQTCSDDINNLASMGMVKTATGMMRCSRHHWHILNDENWCTKSLIWPESLVSIDRNVRFAAAAGFCDKRDILVIPLEKMIQDEFLE